MFVDSHCHIDCIDLEIEHQGNMDVLIKEAAEAGVDYFLCVSIEPQYYERIRALSARYSNVFHSYGIHPNVPFSDISVSHLVERAGDKKCIAIGETGLDYFRSEGDLAWQRDQFVTHIDAAKVLQKPLIIHMRDATEDTIALMKSESASTVGGVMHCFSEDYAVAKRALDLGFYISLSGIVTFKSAHQLHEVAKKIPLDRLLIETDSPYLAPTPYRGKVNRPAWVKYVAEHIALLRNSAIDEIGQQTTENFFSLFQSANAAL